MNEYAELKRHADELSRLLQVPMPGHDVWDNQLHEALSAIRIWGDEPTGYGAEAVAEELSDDIPPPLKPLEEMTRTELVAELGLKSSGRSKDDLKEMVENLRKG